jgi:hypothetical protein
VTTILGLEKYQSYSSIVSLRDNIKRKVKKLNKFSHKVQKIISDVEGRKIDSLSESLKWLKGLL